MRGPALPVLGLGLCSLLSPAQSQPGPEPGQQDTPAVLLPGLYLDKERSPLAVGTRVPPTTLPHSQFSGAARSGVATLNLEKQWGQKDRSATLVVFWAFWCDTWKDMTKELLAMRPELAKQKISVVVVNVDAAQQPVARPAFERGRIWYPVLIDGSGTITEQWGVRRVPTLFLVNPGGVVQRHWEGFPGRRAFWRQVRTGPTR